MEKRERLISLSDKYEGDWVKIARALDQGEICPRRSCDHALTIFDREYPKRLRELRFPPWVLYYRGNLSLLKKPSVTVIGSRSLSNYGSTATKMSVDMLKDRFVLVSGLARGVDGLVHRETIRQGGKTIGVVGGGVDVRYPRENTDLYEVMEKEHLVLSEYPDHTGIQKYHFPWRNRILAALSDHVVVTQAAVRSGTMLTVNEALTLSREIYAFPYRVTDPEGEGCNLLIEQGANSVFRPQILKELHAQSCQDETM